jgi:hypothetical protein
LFQTQPEGGDLEAGYGAMGQNGDARTTAAAKPSPLSDQEREEIKAQVMTSSYKLCSTCCSQAFLLFVVFLFVGKLQGAGYSSMWIISPFLFIVSER